MSASHSYTDCIAQLEIYPADMMQRLGKCYQKLYHFTLHDHWSPCHVPDKRHLLIVSLCSKVQHDDPQMHPTLAWILS